MESSHFMDVPNNGDGTLCQEKTFEHTNGVAVNRTLLEQLLPDVKLYQHQQDSLDFINSSALDQQALFGYTEYGVSGSVLCVQMGMGKSLVALCSRYTRPDWIPTDGPTLIICKHVSTGCWESELKKWFSQHEKRYFVLGSGKNYTNSTLSEYDYVIASYDKCCAVYNKCQGLEFQSSYDMLPRCNPLVQGDTIGDHCIYGIKWESIILDESHNIKNSCTLRYKAMMNIASPRRLCLSGSPMMNKEADLCSQVIFCGCVEAMNQKTLTREQLNTWCMFKNVTVRDKSTTEIKVPSPTPSKSAQKESCYIYGDIKVIVREIFLERSAEYEMMENIARLSKNPLSSITLLRQCTVVVSVCLKFLCQLMERIQIDQQSKVQEVIDTLRYNDDTGKPHSKIDKMLEIIEKEIPADEKIVVFSYYVAVLEYIHNHMSNKTNIKSVLFHGQISKKEQIANKEKFDKDDECRCILVSTGLGSESLDFTAGNHVFLLEPWWNYQGLEQAAARTIRANQNRDVKIYKMSMLGTVDMDMERTCFRKNQEISDCRKRARVGSKQGAVRRKSRRESRVVSSVTFPST